MERAIHYFDVISFGNDADRIQIVNMKNLSQKCEYSFQIKVLDFGNITLYILQFFSDGQSFV